MNRKKRYGVWNTKKKEFQFGICEPSKTKARKKLFEKIGKDAYKYRFQIKELKLGNPKAEKLLTIEIGGVTMTNADRIREMSDEELAKFLNGVEEYGISSQYIDVPCDCCCEKTACDECWKEWLKLEVE